MEGDGKATTYAGGWSDYQAQRAETISVVEKKPRTVKTNSVKEKPQPAKASEGLTYSEKHRLEKLPAIIERLEAEIAKLEEFLSDPELFSKEPVKFQKASEGLVERQSKLAEAEEEWLMLEEKADGA